MIIQTIPGLIKFQIMNSQQASNRIIELRDQINLYNYKYYQDHTSLITDKEFDLLLEELIGLENERTLIFLMRILLHSELAVP